MDGRTCRVPGAPFGPRSRLSDGRREGAKWEMSPPQRESMEQYRSRKHERVSDVIASPSFYLVAGARNHLPANRSLGFCFEVTA
jgi:hypothetical protein